MDVLLLCTMLSSPARAASVQRLFAQTCDTQCVISAQIELRNSHGKKGESFHGAQEHTGPSRVHVQCTINTHGLPLQRPFAQPRLLVFVQTRVRCITASVSLLSRSVFPCARFFFSRFARLYYTLCSIHLCPIWKTRVYTAGTPACCSLCLHVHIKTQLASRLSMAAEPFRKACFLSALPCTREPAWHTTRRKHLHTHALYGLRKHETSDVLLTVFAGEDSSSLSVTHRCLAHMQPPPCSTCCS